MRWSRRLSPYVWAIGLCWVLPAVLVLGGAALASDEVANGTCEGIGFGCTISPRDTILFLGMFFVAPAALIAGLVAVAAITVAQAWRDRRRPQR